MKNFLKKMIMFIFVLINVMSIRQAVFADSINFSDYIEEIRIVNISTGQDVDYFKGYEIVENKIILEISEDFKFNGFNDPEKSNHLDKDKFVIRTKDIEEIKVDNPVEVKDSGEIEGLNLVGVEKFSRSPQEWKDGINFNNIGAFLYYGGEAMGEEAVATFDKETPPVFTFTTNDGIEFKLTWEAVKVEVDVEEIIELTVQENATTAQQYDSKVSAGIRDGEDIIKKKSLKKGEKVNITARDGNKSFFKYWSISGLDDDSEFKELFGMEKTTRDIEFTITDDIFKKAKNNKLKIESYYNTYTIVDTSQTDKEYGKVETRVFNSDKELRKDFNSQDGFPLADFKDKIEFKAVPEVDYVFDKWEFTTPNIIGPNSTNPNVDLNSPVIEINLPIMVSASNPKDSYHLRIKAVFTEQTKEIEKIIDIDNEEFIQGYDKYQLPKTVKVRYKDESEGFEIINWDKTIETAILGENIFIGRVSGTDKTVELKVTMRKIIDIKEEEKFQEFTIYNNDWFGEGRMHKLPAKARVIVSDGSSQLEEEINIKNWEGSKVMADGKTIIYYDHGTYDAEGIIEGFNEKIKLKLNVKKESEKAKFNVEFNTNGGSEISPQEVVEGKVSKPNDPVREGYRFIGWYIDDKLSEKFDFNIPITENMTLYAKWEEIVTEELKILSVELLRDGEVVAKGSFKGKNITIILPKEISQEEVDNLINGKYRLKIVATEGSSVSQEGGHGGDWSNGYISNNIMAGEIKKFTVAKGGQSVEYYIEIKEFHNEKEKHIVTFNTNGGNNISSQTVEDGNEAIKPSNPTKDGYKFLNWYTDSSLINIFNFNTNIKEDITLYAKWEAVAVETSARITKFSLLGYEGSIDDTRGYITVYIPYNMDLSRLVPNITLSNGATISPSKDVEANFNRNVYYTVYGQDGNKKEYRVSVTMPRGDNSLENYWDDYYDNYKSKRDDYYKKRSEVSWWEMSQEAKKERDKEALKDNRDELLIYKERNKIMNEIGKIESRFKNGRSSLSISEGYNKIEIKPTVSNFAEGHSNMIIIPKGILSSLPKGEYDYLTYATGVVNIDIYPFMETVTGLRLNMKDVSNDIRQKWNKVKGKGFIFEVESDSTKGGLSYELNLEKKYPIEKIRFVQYDYTKGNFKDVSPEKWYIFDGKIRCENVSAGVYGIIYKD